MPGPVSDSYDPEWGTSHNRHLIIEALKDMYDKVSHVLGDKPPIYILKLVKDWAYNDDEIVRIRHEFTEKEWRIIRFALERSIDSL